MDLVALKVIVEHRSEKLTLPSGIPSTVEQLHETVKETFQLIDDFTLHYFDEDFGDFFTLHTTQQVKHKGTLKVVTILSVVLTLTTLTESETDTTNESSTSASTELTADRIDDTSTSSQETIIQSRSASPPTTAWPKQIIIPIFSMATEAVLRNANADFLKDGTVLNSIPIKCEIREKLAEYMYCYTPYPTGLQIGEVADALVRKHPCLTERGSRNGWLGWMYSLKYKMRNYRAKLRNLEFPEVTCNALKNKRPNEICPNENNCSCNSFQHIMD